MTTMGRTVVGSFRDGFGGGRAVDAPAPAVYVQRI